MACEKQFPSFARNKLSAFQKVLLVQVFRPDRVESAINIFVCEVLGLNNITGISFSFKSLYQDETAPDVPILFITS